MNWKTMSFVLLISGLAHAAPTLTPTSCTLNTREGFQKGRDYGCYTLSVPVFHQKPEQGPYLLHVVRIKGKTSGNPTILINGGPGSNLQFYWNRFVSATEQDRLWTDALLDNGDVILYDQRGTGQSEPDASCSEVQATLCLAESRARGVDVTSLNNVENIADLHDLQQALGGPVNLYGISYGSYLAQQFIKQHPEQVKNTILEGVSRLDQNSTMQGEGMYARYLNFILESCEQQYPCNAAYPRLRKNYAEVLDLLKNNPLYLSVGPREVVLDDQEMEWLLFNWAYGEPQNMPYYMNELVRQYYPWSTRLVEHFDNQMQNAMGWVMRAHQTCTMQGPMGQCDTTPYLNEKLQFDAVPEDFAKPLNTDLPILLISGSLDPVTPPQNALAVQQGLKNAKLLLFQGGGHAQYPTPEAKACHAASIKNFLQLGLQGDFSCMNRLPAFQFTVM